MKLSLSKMGIFAASKAACVAIALSLCAPMLSQAGVADGHKAILDELPAGQTVETAPMRDLLVALRRAAAKDENLAPDIGAAVVKARFKGGAGVAASGPSDGKSVVSPSTADGKEVVDPKGGPGDSGALTPESLGEMARAIIEGATPAGETPDPQLVASVLQAMMWAMPPDGAIIGALLLQNVLTGLPAGIAAEASSILKNSGLRPVEPYKFTAPPGAIQDPPVPPTDEEPSENPPSGTPRPPRPGEPPVPVPTPPVTPFQNV